MEVNNFDSFNIYCGPAVLSIFTGARVDDCAEEIAKISGAFKVKGVYPGDLMRAGEAMGLEFKQNDAFAGRSIFWMGSVLVRMPPGQYLVTIPKHYIALEVRDGHLYICDNHTKTELELQNSARLSQKVEQVWRVTKVREYSKPHVVKTEYAAELITDTVDIRCINTLSDGGVKIIPLGSFKVPPFQGSLQDIAFAVMELTHNNKG
jgi:hypothetical protein